MPIATIENNVPFQQTNVLDSFYKGQTQRLDIDKAKTDATNAGVDRDQELEKKRWQRLARKVGAYDTAEKWNGNEAALRKIAQEEGVEYQPWGDGTTYDKIMRMGADIDPQLLRIKEMTAEKSSDPKTLTTARFIKEDQAARPEAYQTDPALRARAQWAEAVMTNAQKMINVAPGGEVHKPPSYSGFQPPPLPPEPPPPPQNGAPQPPPSGPQPVFRGAVPVEATKLKGEAESKITTYGLNLKYINQAISDFEKTPKLLEGGVMDRLGYAINSARGQTTDEGVAYNQAYQAITKMSNANLLDAKGTQTEGDAVRAMAEFLDSPGDRKLMQLALTKIKGALEEKMQTAQGVIGEIDKNYGPLGGQATTGAPTGITPPTRLRYNPATGDIE